MRVLVDFKMATDGVDSIQYLGYGIYLDNTLKFIDEAKDYYHFQFLSSESVSFNRNGSSNLSIQFVHKSHSEAKWMQDGITVTLEVHTTNLIVENNRLDILYQITDGESTFSNHHLMLVWENQRKE